MKNYRYLQNSNQIEMDSIEVLYTAVVSTPYHPPEDGTMERRHTAGVDRELWQLRSSEKPSKRCEYY